MKDKSCNCFEAGDKIYYPSLIFYQVLLHVNNVIIFNDFSQFFIVVFENFQLQLFVSWS